MKRAATPRLISPARAAIVSLAALAACAAPAAKPTPAPPAAPDTSSGALAPARVARLRAYIHDAWAPLTRTAADLPRAAEDDKIPHAAGAPWPVYLPTDENRDAVTAALGRVLLARDLARIELWTLPRFLGSIRTHGLLYLPRPYVVPGGRFNEMYGWDSYFIVLGLLRDGRVDLARDIVDDFRYEVRHYGAVLNANRTYYLTRSQPPLLSEMVLAVYRATGDRAWLAAAYPDVASIWTYWADRPPHLIPSLGLSRYYDHGEGPAFEVVAGERDDHGRNHYDRVRAWFRDHPDASDGSYSAKADALSPQFYEGDRAMRESGFDPTGRFGPFGADTTRVAPVCLNTLLYQLEIDLAEIDDTLGNAHQATLWMGNAAARKARIESLLWDDAAGLYFDYDFEHGRRNVYPFATTFWPLWAGIASTAHAARVRANLPLYEARGGIVTSTTVTGAQWDAPFGWAPLQLFAVRGLRRYGFAADADRLARAWLSMLADDLERRGTLVEKYDVVRRTSDVAGQLAFGYKSNEIGFGWTNGVALELLDDLRANASR